MEKSARFKYNLSLEYVMQDFFGPKHYSGMAGAFRDPTFSKKAMLSAVKRIRRRLDNILTVDDRLRQTTGWTLDHLESNIKTMSEEVNNDWNIITNLLHLIVHLLGYDWLDGQVHRHIVFYQDKAQEQLDWRMKDTREYIDEWRIEKKRRYILVNFLQKNEIPKYQIAKLLGITVRRVNRILLEIEKYEKKTGKSLPKFQKESL